MTAGQARRLALVGADGVEEPEADRPTLVVDWVAVTVVSRVASNGVELRRLHRLDVGNRFDADGPEILPTRWRLGRGHHHRDVAHVVVLRGRRRQVVDVRDSKRLAVPLTKGDGNLDLRLLDVPDDVSRGDQHHASRQPHAEARGVRARKLWRGGN